MQAGRRIGRGILLFLVLVSVANDGTHSSRNETYLYSQANSSTRCSLERACSMLLTLGGLNEGCEDEGCEEEMDGVDALKLS